MDQDEYVMIVDDNLSNLEILSKILEKNNFNILPVNNSMVVMEYLNKKKPVLILLDIMMPDLDGFSLCQNIKENKEFGEIPIIFITGLDGLNDKVRGFKLGAVDYITKPFEKDEVIVRINAHITIYKQKKRLEFINAAKNRFLSILGHDLKSPLSGILGLSKIIAEKNKNMTSEEIDNISQGIYKSLKSLDSLLDNLLNWGLSQIGTNSITITQCTIKDIVTRVMYQVRNTAANKSIKLSYKIVENNIISCDISMIETILRNLIVNAVKFTNKNGSVDLICGIIEDDYHIFKVTDTGIGMSQEEIDRLFMIDKITSKRGTENEKGTGLGLLVCKDFVDRHNGYIDVESNKGEGTEFTVALKDLKKEN